MHAILVQITESNGYINSELPIKIKTEKTDK